VFWCYVFCIKIVFDFLLIFVDAHKANFEKFLIDGSTGKPLRRYPRKYQPYNIADDVAASIQGRQLPPAQANWKEEWRNAAKEAENDTYRFQKGLNYFDFDQ
jgi:hypothetical protein